MSLFRSKSPKPERPISKLFHESSLGAAWRRRKPPENGDRNSKKPSTEVGSATSSVSCEPKLDTATYSDTDNIWVRAEQMLSKDEGKKKILQAYLEILESELGSKLSPSGTADRQKQLCQLLNTKALELEDKKLKVRFGDHDVEVSRLLDVSFKNILIAKDIINSAAIASPPAAIACAGVTIVLTLLVQAVKQHKTLVKGLESTSALICRLPIMETLYRSRAKLSSLNSEDSTYFQREFEANLTKLYSQVLEFQARALCYLRKNTMAQVLQDMFKQDGWDGLLDDIEESETSAMKFSAMINAEEMKKGFEEIQKEQEKDRIWQKMSDRDEKVKLFLKMLYTCPYRDRKERNNERVPGTCEWFTDHPRFRNWNENQISGLLWVSADPGCGKSVLVKYLVDQVLLSTSKRTICYFFFKDDFTDQKSAADAICAILRQLFLAKPYLLQDSIFDRSDIDGEKFTKSFHGLWSTLISVAADQNAGEIVCILDALDECQDDDRTQLIWAVSNLCISHSKLNLKFLLTSRPYDHIRREFLVLENRLPTIHLSGEDEAEVEKISKEIELVIKNRVDVISRKRSLERDEHSFLEEQFKIVPNRTYLWVNLTLDVIENISGFTRGNVRRAISQIPQSVDEAYNKILERSSDAEKAKILLHIVTAATRPLSLAEMSLAMAINETHRSYSDVLEELEPEERFRATVRDLCGLFVVIIDAKIYLLHQTAKEFLVQDLSLKDPVYLNTQYKWKYSLQLQESNRVLAERCIWYLMLDFDKTYPAVLIKYSALNWTAHFHKAGIRSEEVTSALAQELCDLGSDRYKAWSSIYASNVYELPKSCSSLTIAAYFGLKAVVQLLLETGKVDANSKDLYGWTPLWWAARNGHEAVVKLLLETGKADVNLEDLKGQTPLLWAARNRDEAFVKLLLEIGKVDVNPKDLYGRTPLSWAAWNGHSAFVKLLLETSKVDVDSKDFEGRTPLSWAAVMGHKAVVKLLLETRKVDVDSKDIEGRTPLWHAAKYRNEAVVKLLLETSKVDVNSKDLAGWTPLWWATVRRDKAVVKLLLETGKVDVDSKDFNGRTPLSWAAWNRDKAVVKLLLETGKVDVDSKDIKGRTPLSWATSSENEAVVKLLLETGKVDADSKDLEGWTPLVWATGNRNKAVVKLLLETGKVDVNSKDFEGRTPLWWATSDRDEAIIKLLLETSKVDRTERT